MPKRNLLGIAARHCKKFCDKNQKDFYTRCEEGGCFAVASLLDGCELGFGDSIGCSVLSFCALRGVERWAWYFAAQQVQQVAQGLL